MPRPSRPGANTLTGKRKRYGALPPLTAAQRALVEAHMEWACRGASKHAALRQGGISMDELRSHAYLALCLAAQRFDPARGFSFKTFAMPWTESYMKRGFYTELQSTGVMRPNGTPVRVVTRVEMPEHDPVIEPDLVKPIDTRRAVGHVLAVATSKRDRAMVRAYLAGKDLEEIRRAAGVRCQITLLRRFRRLVARAREHSVKQERPAA